jgi:hypothetical protein
MSTVAASTPDTGRRMRGKYTRVIIACCSTMLWVDWVSALVK